MRNLCSLLLAVVIVFASDLVAEAQLNQNQNQNQQTGTGTAGNVSGQTGTSANFSIQRDPNAFIGGSTTFLGGQTAAGASGAGAAGLLGALGSVTGRGNQGFGNQQRQTTQQSTTEPQIRFRIKLGFSHPRPSGTKVSTTFTRRLNRIPQLASAGSVAVTMEDRTAVLAGQVDSEREKRLIEKLAMMEPGVAEVRNELTVIAAQEPLPRPPATN